jgi:dTDP-glucose 4,6-dehydratase
MTGQEGMDEGVMRILVTGGAGFIGSNFIHYFMKEHKHCRVVNLDKLTYAGNLENLIEWEGDPRYRFVKGDIADSSSVERIIREEKIDCIVNFAAQSHVDRSIEDARAFVETNVLGTQILLEVSRRLKISRFVQISTDEVYGSLGEKGSFTEDSPLCPNNPYSASKASADLICLSYWKTYGFPVIITRSSNNYGPYQFPEKLIPLFITNAFHDEPLPVYGDGLYVRDWIHVEDNCRAIDLVLNRGREGEIYNIGGNCERTNLDITLFILDYLKKPHSLIRFVKDRPGHDRRYALNSTKIESELNWNRRWTIEKGLIDTIEWYKNNSSWWERIKSGDYSNYYERMYRKRLEESEKV